MNTRCCGFLLSLCFIGTSGNAGAGDWSQYRLGIQGFGPLRIGMSQKAVKKLGLTFRDQYPPPDDPDAFACHRVTAGKRIPLVLMFEKNILTRIETYKSKTVKTVSGVRIGMTEKNAKKTYGERLLVEQDNYDPVGHYLKWFSTDGRSAMVFETDGSRVTNMIAGLKMSAQYIEGCE